MKTYARPLGILSGDAARRAVANGVALPLAGGPLAFTLVEMIERRQGAGHAMRRIVPAATVSGTLSAHASPRPALAHLPAGQPLIMGIVNATPDSFSDGGAFLGKDKAVARGLSMIGAGAGIIDIGGESTRPGAISVLADEEIARVAPVIAGLGAGAAASGALISIDTRNARTMEAALGLGAGLVNDVSALTHDARSMAVAARSGASVVLMHMLGEPATMQLAPRYDDVALDVYDYLEARIAACRQAGIPLARIVIDPGIGFGKTVPQNLALLEHLSLFHGLGVRVMVGVSRKGFIGNVSLSEPPLERLPGSLAAMLAALSQGVDILRVHDVAESVQAVKVALALRGS